jgi:hypothetical protein
MSHAATNPAVERNQVSTTPETTPPETTPPETTPPETLPPETTASETTTSVEITTLSPKRQISWLRDGSIVLLQLAGFMFTVTFGVWAIFSYRLAQKESCRAHPVSAPFLIYRDR